MAKINHNKIQDLETHFLSMYPAYYGCSVVKISLACVAILIVTTTNAYAYIDPGSGALIWQLLLAAFFGAIFYIRKVRSWIQKIIEWAWSIIIGIKS